jgi:RNA polymerase sigma factor (sigma-70 family)
MLSSREDAEDVLQEVFAAAFNAILGDEREINVRPWLYRIARNRSLNHLRKTTAIGVDSMDVHLSEGGETTAEKVHKREEFRLLMADVQDLPETQRTALLLREIDALSYEQIAEAMETTVPSVKSLLVRARVSLAEASEARMLTCDEVRDELGQVAEGLARTTAPARRHIRTCERCGAFRKQLRQTNRQLAMLFPVGPLLFLKKTMLAHLGTTAAASGGSAAASGAAAGAAGAAAGGALQAGMTTIATKAAAGLAAAAIVTAAGVEVQHVAHHPRSGRPAATLAAAAPAATTPAPAATATPAPTEAPAPVATPAKPKAKKPAPDRTAAPAKAKAAATPTPTPTPTPTAEPAANTVAGSGATSTEQHDGDTTTLPTETTGSVGSSSGSLPSEQSGDQPPAEGTQPPPAHTGGEPTPQPTPAASPTPEPSPTPASDPGYEPAP